jgi:hypothetical protein
LRQYFRIYYKRHDGNIGAGVEHYLPGAYPTELKLFASVFIKQNLSDYDLICRLIDSYCPTNSPVKLMTSQLVDRYTLDHLRTRYPNIVFRRIRGSQIHGVKELASDALLRRSTVVEHMDGEQ